MSAPAEDGPSIRVSDASLVFPMLGGDSRFIGRTRRSGGGERPVGGELLGGQRPGVLALDGINIELNPGDRLGIFGHNGAGKSTLLRVLGGILPPTTGRVEIRGRVMGMFTLSLGMNKEVSGLDNIYLKGMLYGLSRAEVDARVEAIKSFSELGDYIYMPVKTYSSGMAMRLQFAIATTLEPEILLLDEWLSTADSAFRVKIQERLDAIIEATPIVVIASHNAARLKGWANRVVDMEGGRIISDQDTTDVSLPERFKPDAEQFLLYRQYMNLGMEDRARDMIDTLWPFEQASTQHRVQLARHHMLAENTDEAKRLYRELHEENPADARYLATLGRLHFKDREYEEAYPLLRAALRISDGTVGDWTALTVTARELEKPEPCPEEYLGAGED